MSPGATFLGFDPRNHLWVVLSNQTPDGKVAIANLTGHWGQSCLSVPCTVFSPGEHPYIAKESCLYFRGAQLAVHAELDRLCATGLLKAHAPFSRALVDRAIQGALNHKSTTRAVKNAILSNRP